MKKLSKKYISVDIEANGGYPWNSSMISLGACVVDGKFDKTFYAELKPIRKEYILENFRIGCSSLNILKNYNFDKFNPEEHCEDFGEMTDNEQKKTNDQLGKIKERMEKALVIKKDESEE